MYDKSIGIDSFSADSAQYSPNTRRQCGNCVIYAFRIRSTTFYYYYFGDYDDVLLLEIFFSLFQSVIVFLYIFFFSFSINFPTKPIYNVHIIYYNDRIRIRNFYNNIL